MTTNATEKTVTNISIRSAYDSLGDIMGKNARNMIFRSAGLERVIGSPPEFTWDKNYTNDEQLAVYQETIKLVGENGGGAVVRQIAYKNAEETIVKFNILSHIAQLPPAEKFEKALEFLSIAINRGRIAHQDEGKIAFDVFNCTACQDISSKRPYCSHYSGAIQFLLDWSFGKAKFIVRETRCKALGDETCFFEIKKR